MKINRRTIINVVIAVAIYGIVQGLIGGGMLSRQMTSLIIPICVYVMMAVSLCLVVGFLGELSLGHAGFMSIGAYSGALFLTHTELPQLPALLIALLIGGAAAAVFGLIIGVPVLRLTGDYLAIVTLGFGEIIKSIINFMTPITGGAKGLSKIPLYTTYRNFTFVFILTVIVVLLVSNIVHSRHGRAITSIRDNYIAAEAAGIPVSRYKIMTFVIAAFFAGVAGALYSCANATLSTSSFAFTNGGILNSTFIVVMVVLGGMGSITGSVAAAVIMFFINYQIKNGSWVDSLPAAVQAVFQYPMLVYAIVLIVVIMFRPRGIFGSYEFSLINLKRDLKAALERRAAAKAERKEARSNG